MLIQPNLEDKKIAACLQKEYGLQVKEMRFLPLGADFNTIVYRVSTIDKIDYFLKLRRGTFSEYSVAVPKYLAGHGLKQVIPPLATTKGKLWTELASFNVMVYPYVQGFNAIEVKLSDQQWVEFGATMKQFHSIAIPAAITSGVPREAFSDTWRTTLKTFMNRIDDEIFQESIAAQMASFLKSKKSTLLKVITRAQDLADRLKKQSPEYVLCHGDIHGWNLLLDKKGALHIVDWDTLMFAPKERDLMFVGAGIGDSGRTALEEEKLFYKGYGNVPINQAAIAYYRYERVIQDIVAYFEHIMLSNEDKQERLQSFEYVQLNFLPNGTIERACQFDTGI